VAGTIDFLFAKDIFATRQPVSRCRLTLRPARLMSR
jgi:hypothetical protein